MNKKSCCIASLLVSLFFSEVSCKKQNDFLNEKPSASLSTITSLDDCQNILNNQLVFTDLVAPGLGETACDDYYVAEEFWANQFSTDQNTYTWAKSIYPAGSDVVDWTRPYTAIYYANLVLDALPNVNVPTNQQARYDQIKGAAIFYRSLYHYDLLQTFSLPYDSVTASIELGVPLRLNSNLNLKSTRPSEKVCYEQIISDLQVAAKLLPPSSSFPEQPNQVAAQALLARIFLAIGNYSEAYNYSNLAMSSNNYLLDYNTITAPPDYSFADQSEYPLKEDIFHYLPVGTMASFGRTAIVDSALYFSYDSDDLRKTLYFANYLGHIRFKGSYEFRLGGYDFFGLATDEMYLIRAECSTRLGNASSAISDLNKLLVTRWRTGKFNPYGTSTTDSALMLILSERRKELCFRGLRWTDLRRLNKDPKYAVTMTRFINGMTYVLPPNDPRYAMPIPDDEIQTSGIQQNNR